MKRGLKTAAVVLCLTLGLVFWFGSTSMSLALGSAKVVANSGIIREKADTGSERLASVTKGDKLDVISQTSDSDGYTWYKVYVDGEKTGYVRADVVSVEGTIPAESADSSGSNNNESSSSDSSSSESSSGGNVTVVGSNNSTSTSSGGSDSSNAASSVNVSTTDWATAKTVSEVRVREGAGTNTDTVTVAKANTEVNVRGVADDNGGSGKKWYQISYSSGDKSIDGFIREDFLELLTKAVPTGEETAEETPAEETAPEEVLPAEPVNNDYQLEYKDNGTGTQEWFLNDNIQGTSRSLTQILSVVAQAENGELENAETASSMKMIIIAMAVVLVILVAAVTILAFKLHDAYEYEYEDEEEEEDEDDGDEEEEEPIRAPRKEFFRKKPEPAPVREQAFYQPETEERPAEKMPEEKPAARKPAREENKSWQSKDFLELDDDMEFEFLDL